MFLLSLCSAGAIYRSALRISLVTGLGRTPSLLQWMFQPGVLSPMPPTLKFSSDHRLEVIFSTFHTFHGWESFMNIYYSNHVLYIVLMVMCSIEEGVFHFNSQVCTAMTKALWWSFSGSENYTSIVVYISGQVRILTVSFKYFPLSLNLFFFSPCLQLDHLSPSFCFCRTD